MTDYKKGFQDGLYCFAWHGKDGLEVGTCGTTLKGALEKIEELFNYDPPEETGDEVELALRRTVQRAIGWLETITSGDGSGHADLARILKHELLDIDEKYFSARRVEEETWTNRARYLNEVFVDDRLTWEFPALAWPANLDAYMAKYPQEWQKNG